MASTRRFDRLVLGGRWATLSRLHRVDVVLKQSDIHSIANDFINWFVPVLRYHNPKVHIDVIQDPEISTDKLVLLAGNDEITHQLSADDHKSSHHLMQELLKLDQRLTKST
eukprot:GHVS01105549.1.p1 GENE.GHVS01105549.1~~GHVS01105549.1.p1  ORF type:complete len:111 (+),score=9.17 GHVS01105549.1:273-605(+)